MLLPAVAAPPDRQTALKHDDDFGVANLDFAEFAFQMTPAFRQEPLPVPTLARLEPDPGRVFRTRVAAQTTRGVETRAQSPTL